ncbi:MAG: helix-turn-helix domain containing protein [candidate division Zixibacteria bacterium]|nr:helix-turn-helix domain containing protein [candidate division Zixibacteria bacterium]
MPPEIYTQRIKDSLDPQGCRKKMIRTYYVNHCNLSLTARAFGCDRKTLRKWVKQFQNQKSAGLVDRRGKSRQRRDSKITITLRVMGIGAVFMEEVIQTD